MRFDFASHQNGGNNDAELFSTVHWDQNEQPCEKTSLRGFQKS